MLNKREIEERLQEVKQFFKDAKEQKNNKMISYFDGVIDTYEEVLTEGENGRVMKYAIETLSIEKYRLRAFINKYIDPNDLQYAWEEVKKASKDLTEIDEAIKKLEGVKRC